MPKANNSNENWIGITFANGWEVTQEIGYAEGREMGLGDHNKHYVCFNHNCGVETYMERTSMRRYINDPSVTCVGKCRGCTNAKKLANGTCHYAKKVREKPLYKTPDRTQKIFIGETYNNFTVLSISESGNNKGHQCQAVVKCIHCGREQTTSINALLEGNHACECFKKHSSGEKFIYEYLKHHNINFVTEESFAELVGLKGGRLRYDFAILNQDNKIIQFIEFDGIQHIKTGSLYNPDGTVQIHDSIKNQFAEDNNIPLLRIPQAKINNIGNILDKNLIVA